METHQYWRDLPEFLINDRRVLPRERLIISNHDECRVQDKVMQTLCYLALKPMVEVSHEEIIEHVWNDNYLVGRKGLSNVIWQLRRHLGSATTEDLIETIPRYGYRLRKRPVEVLPPGREDRSSRIRIWHAAVALVSAVIVGLGLYSQSQQAVILSINQALSNPAGVVVYRPEFSSRVNWYLDKVQRRVPVLRQQQQLSLDSDLPTPDGKTWVLYGSSKSNPIINALQSRLDYEVHEDYIRVKSEKIEGVELRLVLTAFYPDSKIETPVVIYSSASDEGLLGIHDIRHGATNWLVVDRLGRPVAEGPTP